MDLALHARVLWRNKLTVLVGVLIGILLAFLAFVRVSPDGVAYRQAETWQSNARLFASQGGSTFSPAPDESGGIDPTSFAVLLAEFANSDAVMRTLESEGPVDGQIVASADQVDDDYLPFIEVAGIAATPETAQSLARRATAAIQKYAVTRQTAQGIKPSRQIHLEIINQPADPVLVEGRSKTLPVMVLFGVVSIVFIFIYTRENIRRQDGAERALDELTAPQATAPPAPSVVDVGGPVAVETRPERDAPAVGRWSAGPGRRSQLRRASGDGLDVREGPRQAEQGQGPAA